MAITNALAETDRCPFCGRRLAAPRKGFPIHVAEHPDCDAELEAWRELADDGAGGCSG